MQVATPETVLGDFDDAVFVHRGVTSTFYRQEDRFFVRTEGPDGELLDYSIDYAFGVEPLQQYLVPFPGGRYQVLGIAWDSRAPDAGGQRWFHLYPDVDADSPLHWTRPRQTWNTACAECHSTGLTRGFDVPSLTFRTTWSEIDVSCEACHGPASRHVALAEAAAEPSGGRERSEPRGGWGLTVTLRRPGGTWTLPDGGTTARRTGPPGAGAAVEVETCAPCHARRATISETHVPGDPLLDAYRVSLLREGLYHADGQIDDEVYVYGSFVQSRMYAAGVTCSDCHDPHSLATRAEGNALCTRCHRAGHYDDASHHFHPRSSRGALCVECHMPSKTYMVVDPRRDHGIRVPRPDLGRDLGTPDACTGCHQDRSVAWATDAFERWYGTPAGPRSVAGAIQGGRRGDPEAVPLLVDLAGDALRPPIVRATALSLLGAYGRPSLQGAVQAGLADPEPLVRIGALEAAAGLPPDTALSLARPHLEDGVAAVRLQAARLVVEFASVAPPPWRASVVAAGWAEVEKAHRANVASSGAWVELGDLHAAAGRASEAEAAFRTALAIDPTELLAYLNLADLQRALGRDDLAEETLRQARTVAPDAPEALHATGLLEVRKGDVAEALGWLEGAAALRPENPRFGYVYGVALASSGAMDDAIRVLEDALRLHPYDPDILAALAAYARDRGDVDGAIRYAERLVEVVPDDRGAHDVLARLRAR
jgi:predicted CXXCH cytochrome family protein